MGENFELNIEKKKRNYFHYTSQILNNGKNFCSLNDKNICLVTSIIFFKFILPSRGPLISGRPELSNLPY